MSEAVQFASITASGDSAKSRRMLWLIVWTILIAVGIGFFLRHGIHFYLDQSEQSFGRFSSFRLPLLIHITGGLVALLTGPLQFWMGYRRKPMYVHRWVGRVFVAAVALGSVGATWLALTTSMRNWSFAVGLLALTAAWVATTAMAYFAIRNRMIETHKEWMIRAYVVTFAFVTFRLFSDTIPREVVPARDLGATLSWASWVVPLFITEMTLQLKRMRKST